MINHISSHHRKWKMEHGKWNMENGTWKMENGTIHHGDEVTMKNKHHKKRACVGFTSWFGYFRYPGRLPEGLH